MVLRNPLGKTSNLSVWENKNAMQEFAYNLQQHIEVIHKTRNENWYKRRIVCTVSYPFSKRFPESIATKCLPFNPHMKRHNLLAIFLNLI
jgi:hypothetical protein